MMGNFSFGDYFKRDAITMAWDLLINHYKLDVDKLWVTIFEDDDESGALWKEISGLPEHRIQKMGPKTTSGRWEILVLVVHAQKYITIMVLNTVMIQMVQQVKQTDMSRFGIWFSCNTTVMQMASCIHFQNLL